MLSKGGDTNKNTLKGSFKERLIDENDESILERNSVQGQKFKLSWNNITYSVNISKKEQKKLNLEGSTKTILKGVSGFQANGETLFIMGASGAGKTTLLNVLCDWIKNDEKNRLEGSVTINNEIAVK